jgi:GAF domain-containing protein
MECFFIFEKARNTGSMEKTRKEKRYLRLYQQIGDLILKSSNNSLSNMATINAVLYHKMDYFFWCGFYLLQKGKLQVGPYQGSLACIDLPAGTGVCQAAITQKKTLIVPDVEAFPGHIACDGRSRSEIVVPVYDESGTIRGVLDVDSRELNHFDETDAVALEKIVRLVYNPSSFSEKNL